MEPVQIPPPEVTLTRAECLKLAAALEQDPPASLRPVKLAVLATFTADMLRPYLIVEAARRGVSLSWRAGPYGQVEQQIIDPDSGLYAAPADAVLLLLRLADVAPQADGRFLSLGNEGAARERERLKEWLARQLRTLRAHSSAAILVSNFTPPEFVAAGLADAALEQSQAAWVQSVNHDVAETCAAVP